MVKFTLTTCLRSTLTNHTIVRTVLRGRLCCRMSLIQTGRLQGQIIRWSPGMTNSICESFRLGTGCLMTWDRFGGTDGELWFSDLWQYSSSNGWTQLRGSSYFPEGRESHAAAVVDGVMFIFGGCNKEGRDLGDLHGYDFAKRRWSYFGTYHDFPSARSGHQMAVHKEKIIMVGGEPYDREDLAVMYTLSPASCFLRAELFGWSGPPWQNGQGQESKW